MAAENPFPGLRPFELDEAYLFFGRDSQSIEVLRRLRSHRFLAVIGTSGSGKSSLIRAGLLVALYGGEMTRAGSRWRHAIFRPGNRPIGNLADALAAPGVLPADGAPDAGSPASLWLETTLRGSERGLVDAVRQAHLGRQENLLVVVDQMEELFRFQQPQEEARAEGGRREDEAAAFVKLLLEAARQDELPIYVVITMRSDYIGDCARFRGLPEAVNEGLYLIPRMTREQRKEAITGPVAVGGAQITPRLVNRLLNDLGDDPDQLPILQHALMRTWDLWAGTAPPAPSTPGSMDLTPGAAGPLDLPHYAAIGGMDRALSDHADEAYRELPDDHHREIAKQLFQLLTEKGPDNREVRRPARLGEIAARTGASLAEIQTVIEVFGRPGRSFLTSPGAAPLGAGSEIDISHESLIRGWRTLKQWVEEESDSAREFRRLADTAARHAAGKADLLHDPDLAVALKWREEQRPNAEWAKRYHDGFVPAMALLDASAAARDAATTAAERARLAEIHRTRRGLAVTSALAAIALLLAFLTGTLASRYRGESARAQKAERSAESARRAAEDALRTVQGARRATEIQRREAEDARRQAEAMASEAEGERARAELQEGRANEETQLAQGHEKLAVEYARDVMSGVEALPDATKRQVEVLKLYERLLQGATGVGQGIVQHDPGNQAAVELWVENLGTLPDLHRVQGKEAQADQDCSRNLEEAERRRRAPGYLQHAIGAYLVAACAKTYSRLGLQKQALQAADRAVAAAESARREAPPADGLDWRLLSNAYAYAGSVYEYERPLGALAEHRLAVAARRNALGITPSGPSRRKLVEELETVARLETNQKDRETARKTYLEACRLVDGWAAAPAADQDTIEIGVYRHVNFGDALLAWDELAAAEQQYDAARPLLERLDAESADGKLGRLVLDERFGDLWRSRSQSEKDTERARQLLRTALEFHARSLDQNRRWAVTDQSAERRRSLAISELRVAQDHRELKEYVEARRHYLARIEVFSQRRQLEPGDAADIALARAYGDLAALEEDAGDRAAERKALDGRLAILRELAGRQPAAIASASRGDLVEELEAAAEAEAGHGARDKARETYAEACRLAEGWAAGASPTHRSIDLAGLRHLYFGDALRHWGELAAAEKEYEAARTWVERLDAGTADGEMDRVLVDERFGSLWRERARAEKDPVRAREDLHHALDFHTKSLERHRSWAQSDQSAWWLRNLAIEETQVAQDDRELEDHAAARVHLAALVELRQQLARLEPGAGAERDLAKAYGDLAALEEKAGEPAAQRAALEQRLTVLRRLAESQPRSAAAAARRELVEQLEEVAELEARRGGRDQAREAYAEACRLAESWAAGAAPTQEAIDLATLRHVYFGDAWREWGDLAQAEREYDAARSWVERLATGTADGEVDRLMVDERFGSLWRDRARADKDPARAHTELERALSFHTKSLDRQRLWVKSGAPTAERLRNLAIGELQVADDLSELKDHAAARGHYLARVEARKQVARLAPGESADRAVADAYGELATCEHAAGDVVAARAATDAQITLLRPLAEQPAGKTPLARAYGHRSWYDVLLGDSAAAVKDAETGLGLDAKELWILTNEAHGYLLAGNVEAARRIYLDNAGKQLAGETFKHAVLDDFKQFRERPPPRLDLKVLAKVEAELAAAP